MTPRFARPLVRVAMGVWLCGHAGVTLVAQPQPTELSGVTSSVRGDCPSVTFSARGLTISTSEATEFEGVSCADLQDGVPVEIEGMSQPGGTVSALEIEVNHQGTIEAMRGACPDLAFGIGAVSVSTDRDTDFDGIRCQELRDGVRVEVDGDWQPAEGLRAHEVESADDDDDDEDNDEEDEDSRR